MRLRGAAVLALRRVAMGEAMRGHPPGGRGGPLVALVSRQPLDTIAAARGALALIGGAVGVGGLRLVAAALAGGAARLFV